MLLAGGDIEMPIALPSTRPETYFYGGHEVCVCLFCFCILLHVSVDALDVFGRIHAKVPNKLLRIHRRTIFGHAPRGAHVGCLLALRQNRRSD